MNLEFTETSLRYVDYAVNLLRTSLCNLMQGPRPLKATTSSWTHKSETPSVQDFTVFYKCNMIPKQFYDLMEAFIWQ